MIWLQPIELELRDGNPSRTGEESSLSIIPVNDSRKRSFCSVSETHSRKRSSCSMSETRQAPLEERGNLPGTPGRGKRRVQEEHKSSAYDDPREEKKGPESAQVIAEEMNPGWITLRRFQEAMSQRGMGIEEQEGWMKYTRCGKVETPRLKPPGGIKKRTPTRVDLSECGRNDGGLMFKFSEN